MIEITEALPADATAISRVLIASITELCAADHGGNPALIAGWTANKTPGNIGRWIAGPEVVLVVARRHGLTAGVGGWTAGGEIALNYVAPEFRGQGVSTAMLVEIERQMRSAGMAEGRLTSTMTALAFYRARGWIDDGPREIDFGMPGQPMRKSLIG